MFSLCETSCVWLSVKNQEKAYALGTSNFKYFYLEMLTVSVWCSGCCICLSAVRQGFNSKKSLQFLCKLKSFPLVSLVTILTQTKPKSMFTVNCIFIKKYRSMCVDAQSVFQEGRMCTKVYVHGLSSYTHSSTQLVSVSFEAYARTHK